MGVGKFSPTENTWYRRDQTWHHRHCDADSFVDGGNNYFVDLVGLLTLEFTATVSTV